MTSFRLGQCSITLSARDAASELNVDVRKLLQRHLGGDWGDLSAHDRAANNAALSEGNRLLSAYRVSETVKIWIITEGDRSATTVMLPDDY